VSNMETNHRVEQGNQFPCQAQKSICVPTQGSKANLHGSEFPCWTRKSVSVSSQAVLYTETHVCTILRGEDSGRHKHQKSRPPPRVKMGGGGISGICLTHIACLALIAVGGVLWVVCWGGMGGNFVGAFVAV
jgi:hypothetical protein